MSDYTNLIRELRESGGGDCDCRECTRRRRATEALEAVTAERDALAAEVERLKLVHVGQARLAMLTVYLADVDGDEATQAFYREWVRAHDRQVAERAWEEGARWGAVEFGKDASMDESQVGLVPSDNPYRKEQENNDA